MLPAAGPPLDPSSEDAHRWVVEELSRHEYDDRPGLWDRFVHWLSDLLHGVDGPRLPATGAPAWVLVAVTLVVLAVLAYAVVRHVRREARGTRGRRDRSVVEGVRRTAAEYRAEAAAALDGARWDDAVLAGFRAVATAAVDRSVLEESPGRTAHEVARDLGPFFGSEAAALDTAARAFDAVRYGHLPADEATARQVVETDARVERSRPDFGEAAPAGAPRGGAVP